jgi:MATE family multidrug resistance protein
MSWSEKWRGPGGGRELLALAFPLILSNSLWTLQITIDRVMLGQLSSNAVGAAMAAVLVFWTPLALLQSTCAYATTFVAQYHGAGRPRRVGPAVWQALYFAVATGLGFLVLLPMATPIIALGGHSPDVQLLEVAYFRCLCFSALPTLIVAAVSGFFAGRGDSWTVLLINGVGLVVNAVLDYVWIFGKFGQPRMEIAGAGWATVAGISVSAALGLALMLRRRHREAFATLGGWRFDAGLFGRLMYYGLPSGFQWFLDGLAFTVFIFLIGRLGDAELAASSIAFAINMFAFLPMLGIGQAVTILVGQRLGQDRSDLAERSTWTGFGVTWLYMSGVAALYVLVPGMFVFFFEPGRFADGEHDPAIWPQVAVLVPVLLRFVAVYSLFDGLNLVLSFALKGAGDTRFVTLVSLTLSWPMMVLPTWAVWHFGWGLSWAWAAASAYIITQALVFLVRFLGGKWKSMRVIEAAPVIEQEAALADCVVP